MIICPSSVHKTSWFKIVHLRKVSGKCKYQGKMLTGTNSKIVQNIFDSWKCQLLCNKMSKVENSYKPRLKSILKQHHSNFNMAQMNKYSCTQIFIFVHMDRFAYMQNLRICKSNLHLVPTRCKFQDFAYGAHFAYVCKSIHMDRCAHMSIFACKYLHT